MTNVRGDQICWGWDENNIGDHGDWSLAQTHYGQTLPAATPTVTATPTIIYPERPAIPAILAPQDNALVVSGNSVTFQWELLSYPVTYLIYVYNENGVRIADSGDIVGTSWQFTFPRSGVYYWSLSTLCNGCQSYFGGYSQPQTVFVDVEPTPTPSLTPTTAPPTPTPTPTTIPACLLSIGNGQLYTNQTAIILHASVPDAAEILLSNDRGFGGATWQPYAGTIAWQLPDPGQRVVSLLVYAQFRNQQGESLCSGLAISDDIIYDPLPPIVRIVSIDQIYASAAQSATTATGTVMITASDQTGGSGVAEMRIGTKADLVDSTWRNFTTSVQMEIPSNSPIYAQVRDRAGNLSAIAEFQQVTGTQIFLPIIQQSVP